MADFPAIIDLGTLDGSDGFRLDGVDDGDYSGFSVASAGDVNGDGFDDLVIGAYRANAGSGQTYVVFGSAGGFPPAFDLATLDGDNGFRLDGANDFDLSGFSVASAGDFNDDGFADLIVGAWRASPGGASYAGESYVVFGHGGVFGSSIDLGLLDGTDGFRLEGLAGSDYSGWSVASAGDVNGDGFDDLIIGAPYAAGGDPYAGESYVVFGGGGPFPASFDLASLDGTNGFRLAGIDPDDGSGWSVASAGDINGDGFADLIVGAPYADGDGAGYGYGYSAGETYVVHGKASFDAVIDLSRLNGRNGFRLDGTAEDAYAGFSVASAGDINGDGFDDLIVGAWGAGGDTAAGQTFVVFGHPGDSDRIIDLGALTGADGFRIDGSELYGYSGLSVASAGDVNGDGFDDLIIGAPGCGCYAGSGYVVFGHAGAFAPAYVLSGLDGDNGFVIEGIEDYDRLANSVASAGDINGDGFADVIIGAPGADAGGPGYAAGETYVVFGRAPTAGVTRIGSTGDQTILGGAFDDTLMGLGGNDLLEGGDGDDRLDGGKHDDTLLGGDGADKLIGRAGFDTMIGGAGNDVYHLGVTGNVVVEDDGGGRDLVRARVDYSLADYVEDLRLLGTAVAGTGNGLGNLIVGSDDANTLAGLGGTDILRGKAGNDELDGGDDADLLDGGAGTDTLTGGAARDVFLFREGDTAADRAFADTVIDFSQADLERIHLKLLDADIVAGDDQAFTFIGDAAFSGIAGELHYVHDGGMTYVEGDTDGDFDADFVIALAGTIGLVAGDFVL